MALTRFAIGGCGCDACPDFWPCVLAPSGGTLTFSNANGTVTTALVYSGKLPDGSCLWSACYLKPGGTGFYGYLELTATPGGCVGFDEILGINDPTPGGCRPCETAIGCIASEVAWAHPSLAACPMAGYSGAPTPLNPGLVASSCTPTVSITWENNPGHLPTPARWVVTQP